MGLDGCGYGYRHITSHHPSVTERGNHINLTTTPPLPTTTARPLHDNTTQRNEGRGETMWAGMGTTPIPKIECLYFNVVTVLTIYTASCRYNDVARRVFTPPRHVEQCAYHNVPWPTTTTMGREAGRTRHCQPITASSQRHVDVPLPTTITTRQEAGRTNAIANLNKPLPTSTSHCQPQQPITASSERRDKPTHPTSTCR